MAEDLATVWDNFETIDREVRPHTLDGDQSWDAPNLGALVRAVRRTSLHRLFPFTTLNQFCLGDGSDFWKAGADGGQIAPAFVARTPERGYLVWAGNPYHDVQTPPVLVTKDPEAAARCLERLLADWPGDDRPGSGGGASASL